MIFSKRQLFIGSGIFCLVGTIILTSLYIFLPNNDSKPIVIWTDEAELISYAELFNKTQDTYKVLVKYKKNPTKELTSNNNDLPDIVIAPWLKTEKIRRNFISLEKLFGKNKLLKDSFYPQLLDLGSINHKQFLIPISFNLPLVIYDTKNEQLIPHNAKMDVDEIQRLGKIFNKKNASGFYTAIGFSPRWNADFMYITSKIQGADFQEDKTLFSYNNENLQKTIKYFQDWTLSCNTSFSSEDDFQFKYFYMPTEKLVKNENILFAYMTSNEFFVLQSNKLENINFSWVHQNEKIPLLDKLVYLGVHKKARNKKGAYAFIHWFLNTENQESILERTTSMNLLSKPFGIAGGFSAIKNVTEQVFPSFYPLLQNHLPTPELLQPPNILPPRWNEIKEKIIFPYLNDSVINENPTEIDSIEQRISEWLKQN
ncbi:MAG: extracellular solute-binding protein [Treponemataceae bacterium]